MRPPRHAPASAVADEQRARLGLHRHRAWHQRMMRCAQPLLAAAVQQQLQRPEPRRLLPASNMTSLPMALQQQAIAVAAVAAVAAAMGTMKHQPMPCQCQRVQQGSRRLQLPVTARLAMKKMSTAHQAATTTVTTMPQQLRTQWDSAEAVMPLKMPTADQRC